MSQFTKILHIGFHKTGTTYLQQYVFPSLADVTATRGWDPIWSTTNSSPKRIWLHSDEGLSGSPWGNEQSYKEGFYNRIETALEYFQPSKIIVTVRPLESWFESLYKQYLNEGGYLSPKEFCHAENGVITVDDCLMFPKLVWLSKRVPELLVLSQNEILLDPKSTIRKIENFCGTTITSSSKLHSKANVSVKTALQISFLRRANRLNQRLLIKIHPRLNLYNQRARKFGLSPRQIAQRLLARIPGSKAEVDFGHSTQDLVAMKSDWESIKLEFKV